MARYNESTDNDNITTLGGNPRKFLKTWKPSYIPLISLEIS